MNAIQKRFLMFLGGCIPLRLLLVYIAKNIPLEYLPYMGIVTLLPAFGFIYLYLSGQRTVGLETQGAPIWWAPFRIIHGLLYLAFSIYALNRVRTAYRILAVDVILGLGLFLWHHYQEGNFAKVLL